MNTGSINGFAINGSSLDASVRSQILAYAYAIAIPVATSRIAATTVIDGVLSAIATITPRVIVRSQVSATGEAQANPFVKRFARDNANEFAYASASPVPNSYTRVYVRDPIVQTVSVNGVLIARLGARAPISGDAPAQAAVVDRALVRSAVACDAQAVGYVSANQTVYYPFDELADETFVVPFVDNLFYVR
jgi:hypothetical protein